MLPIRVARLRATRIFDVFMIISVAVRWSIRIADLDKLNLSLKSGAEMLVNTDVFCEELVSLMAFDETFVESLAKTNCYC